MTREQLLGRIWIDPARCAGKPYGSNDAEANVLITRFTEVAWGPRQPKIDLTHDADKVSPIFSSKNQRD